MFDGNWNPVNVGSAFTDPNLPSGYAPFNVAVVGTSVYVSYAKQDADGEEEIAGHNLGFVNKFTDFGQTVQRIASRGNLNAPWGMAIAPSSFGKYAGALLVGNFGDGKIGAYADNGDFLGFLRDRNNDVLSIDGLWALLPGTAASGGTDAVWFSAGPDEETHGLVASSAQRANTRPTLGPRAVGVVNDEGWRLAEAPPSWVPRQLRASQTRSSRLEPSRGVDQRLTTLREGTPKLGSQAGRQLS